MDNAQILKYIGEDVTNETLDTIFNRISHDSSIRIGKKRRSKIKARITEILREKMNTPRNIPNNLTPVGILFKKLQEFGRVERVERFGDTIFLRKGSNTFTRFSSKPTSELTFSSTGEWHLILIHRQSKFQKKQIIEALYQIVKHELFVPYAYREAQEFDYFLIFNQGGALKKFFDADLKITIEEVEMSLIVELSVADVRSDHKKLVDEVFEVVKDRMSNRIFNEDANQRTLDLSNFSKFLEPRDIIFSLSNNRCFNILCDQLNGIDDLKEYFTIFKFANNGICSLEPFLKLHGFKIDVLDLSHNRIPLQEIKRLTIFGIKHLSITGNEGINLQAFRHNLLEILPSLVSIDGLQLNDNPTALLTENKSAPPNPWTRSPEGKGNDPIPKIEDGVYIRGDVRKTNHNFIHLKHTFLSYRDDKMWAEVTVIHNSYAWEEILEEITPIFAANPFFPCYHKRFANHDQFYVHKNFEALHTLMKHNLEYLMPSGGKKLVFSIRLNAAPFKDGQVNWYIKMQQVLKKRVNGVCLDLNDFVKDPDFEKITICINSKYTLDLILDQAKKHNNQIVRINACRNGLKSLEGLQSLNSFTKLQTLDLRDNKILDLTGVSLTSTVNELMLDGNPICEKLSDPHEYISSVREFFNQLEWLDGYHIDKILNFATLQNFLVKRDAYTFAEEFIKTFFNIYDSFERHRLLELYNENSLFTMSVHYDDDRSHSTNIFSRIQKYTKFSRNINSISNFLKASDNVLCGVRTIRKVFEDLPGTKHEYTSFCVDVPYYDIKKKIIITVTGIFSESGQSLNEVDFLLGFVRTFILRPGSNGNYTISNDQVFIFNPSQAQKNEAAAHKGQLNMEEHLEKKCKDLLPTETEEKKMKIMLFRELTELKEDECVRQLEQSFYDIKVALATFNTLLDSGNMGSEKFDFK